MAFAEEREMVERALALAELDGGDDPVFPPVAARFISAREALGLTEREVATQWGQQPSMYWDLELYDNEAFDVISVQDLVTLAAVLKVSVMQLLFGEEPSSPLATTTYSEVARLLRAKMADCGISIKQMSEQVGWDIAEYLNDPERLAELPIFGLRWVCNAANVDWATTLANPRARLTTALT